MRRKPTVTEILCASVGIVVGLGIGAMPSAHAVQEESVEYRVVGSRSDGTMAKEINEASRDGCKPMFGVGSDSEPMVVLECPR